MNPQNMGEIENPDGVGIVGNPMCGDMMKLTLRIKDGIIEDVKVLTFGCVAAIATSSIITTLVKGKSIEEAEQISNKVVAEALDGLPPVKMHCSNLAADALLTAIVDYKKRNNIPVTDEEQERLKKIKVEEKFENPFESADQPEAQNKEKETSIRKKS